GAGEHDLPDRARSRPRHGRRHLPRLRPDLRLRPDQRGVHDMIVLKVGGSVVSIAELGELDDAVVVHGGGPQITSAMAPPGLTATFLRGRRITDAEALPVVREALLEVNRELCAAI